MHPAETHLIRLAHQIGRAGIQGANAYNAAQAELELATVLAPESLATADGTRRSLDRLDRLTALNAAHKQMFEAFTTAAVGQLSALLAELPTERATELQDGMIRSVNWNLKAQSDFYCNRDRWIETASALCRLVDEHRESISFTEEGLVFESATTLERFGTLVSAADEAHEFELKQTAERMSRLTASMAVLEGTRK